MNDIILMDLFKKAILFFEKRETNAFPKEIEFEYIFVTSKYNEGHRHYHNIRHIKSMLILLLEVSKQYNLSKEQFYTLVLAVFYHDIVYIPGGKNNEDESFNICQFHLKQRFSIENVDKLLEDIQFLIECTRIENIGICHNSIPAALMSYMDIASLASDYFVFDDRQNDIIGEACSYHGSFDGGNEFTSKSVEFFEQLLKKKRIFPHHPNMDFSEQEKIARRNMERFIAECKV